MHQKLTPYSGLRLLTSWWERNEVLSAHITRLAQNGRSLNILDAGCGQKWGLRLEDIAYTLTGLDSDEDALHFRTASTGDLDIAICEDLRTVELPRSTYDVIHCVFVLEHIPEAGLVLNRFVEWLKAGGLLILIVPDRDSSFGFVARNTPFRLHVLYKRYIQGQRDAGKPGHDPFPTYYAKVISRNGIHRFCTEHGLTIKAEYRLGGYLKTISGGFRIPVAVLLWGLHLLSLGRLAANHNGLAFVIEKTGSD